MNRGAPESPIVSILINNYNYGRFLREAIDSALGQTYPRTEVIVVDDGSTDDSKEIIASYGERVVSVLKGNGGQASAFNAGFVASQGKIVIFLDADDILLSDTVEKVVRTWRSGLARTQYRLEVINATGRSQGTLVPSGTMSSGDLRNLVLSRLVQVGPPTSGNAFARDVLEQLLPMPEKEWRISADGYLLTLSPFFGEVASLHETLGFYRVHESNNYAMGELDLRKLRRIIEHDVQKQELLFEFGKLRDIKVDKDLALRVPWHVKARIASARLDPAQHPFPQDGLYVLAAHGIAACVRSRDIPLWKKPLLSMWFVLVSLLPRQVIEPVIALGLMPQRRLRLLLRFVIARTRGARAAR